MPEPAWMRFYTDSTDEDEQLQESIRQTEAMRQATPFLEALVASLRRRSQGCRWRPGQTLEQAGAQQVALTIYSDLTDWLESVIEKARE